MNLMEPAIFGGHTIPHGKFTRNTNYTVWELIFLGFKTRTALTYIKQFSALGSSECPLLIDRQISAIGPK
jgi:hypothetical protein